MKSIVAGLLAVLTLALASCQNLSEDEFIRALSSEKPPNLSDIPVDLSSWLVLPLPTSQVQRSAMNYSEYSWYVSLSNGQAHASWWNEAEQYKKDFAAFRIPRGPGQFGMRIPHRVADGWIVGFDEGEFGASTWWFSTDRRSRYKMSNAQVVAFVPSEKEVFVLEGLAHLCLSTGQVMRVVKNGASERWGLQALAPLAEAPDAGTTWGDSLLVVTTAGLVRIDPSGVPHALMRDMFWSGGYPTSIVVDSEDVAYIGMREGVARISLRSVPHQIDWLVPNRRVLDEDVAAVDRIWKGNR